MYDCEGMLDGAGLHTHRNGMLDTWPQFQLFLLFMFKFAMFWDMDRFDST